VVIMAKKKKLPDVIYDKKYLVGLDKKTAL
jgi:hypothetical protein